MWPRGKKDVNTEKMPSLYFNMLGNLKSFSVQFQEFSSAGSGISIPNDTPNKVMAEPATIYIQSAIDSEIVDYPFPVNTSKLFPDKTDSLTFDQFNIYVNSSQLDTYKTADGWKNYADYIHSI